MAHIGTGGEPMCEETRATPEYPRILERKRYIELAQIAHELCGWLEERGVKQSEGCVIRELVMNLWNMKP